MFAADPQKRTKVVRIITRLNVGGPAIHAILLTAKLDGYDSVLVCGSTGPGEANMDYLAAQHGVVPIVVPSLGREVSPLDDLRAVWELFWIIRRERPDLVHTHTAKAGTLGRIAALLAGVPLRVHTFHGHVFNGYFSSWKTQVFLSIERTLARLTDQIVTVSAGQREELAERYRIAPAADIETIELGFDLGDFAAAERWRGQLRAELGVSAATRLVGIVGRMVPIKDHAFFVECAANLVARCAARPEVAPVHFVFVGGGDLEEEVRAGLTARGLLRQSHMLGWRQDLSRIYADLDIVALTSRNEGTPVALIEAIAAGTAVCSVDVGGVSDVLRGGERGVLVKSRTVAAFSDALWRLLDDEPARRALAQRARQSVLLQYDASRLRRDVAHLYDGLVQRRADRVNAS